MLAVQMPADVAERIKLVPRRTAAPSSQKFRRALRFHGERELGERASR